MKKKYTCPSCKSAEVIPLIYGDPDEKLHDKYLRGEVMLGGCMPKTNEQGKFLDTHCLSCTHEWKR